MCHLGQYRSDKHVRLKILEFENQLNLRQYEFSEHVKPKILGFDNHPNPR